VIVAGSWLGHLGGADFVLLTGREYADLAIRGALGRLPGIEVAVATLDCPPGSGLDGDGAIRQLAPVRRIAGQATGSSWAVRIAGQQPIRLHAGTAAATPAAVS
jgi:hypothetical protein